jgi:short-subunit dehydrogenase
VVDGAGRDVVEPFLDASRDLWNRLVELNFMAPADVSRVIQERMAQRETHRPDRPHRD